MRIYNYGEYNEYLTRVIDRYLEFRTPVIACIIGSMGTGKTTVAKIIAHYLVKNHGYTYHYYDRLEDFEEFLNNPVTGGKKVFVLDDQSFQIDTRSKWGRDFLTRLFKIRHILKTNDIWLIFTVHYSRSITPFIRGGQIRILTSITPGEINNLKEIIPEGHLWEFYRYFKDLTRCTSEYCVKVVDVSHLFGNRIINVSYYHNAIERIEKDLENHVEKPLETKPQEPIKALPEKTKVMRKLIDKEELLEKGYFILE